MIQREKAVFKTFYNKVIVPESKGDYVAKKKLIQFDYKIEFYFRDEEKVQDWTELIPIESTLRK